MDEHDRLELARDKARMAWWRKARSCASIQRTRQEMDRELNASGSGPTPRLAITRRIFLHRSLAAGAAAGAATHGWFPLINTLDVAFAEQQAFKFAWISDNHLYPKTVNTRFVDKTVRAAKEVQAMSPAADFLIHGAISPSSAIRWSSTSATTS